MARAPAQIADLKVRMKEPLRAAIEAASVASGLSMNGEAVARLERSFREDELFSSPRMRRWAISMAAQFHNAGTNNAGDDGGQDDWMSDFDTLALASMRLVRALMRDLAQHAECDPETLQLQVHGLQTQLATELKAEGKWKSLGEDGANGTR